MLYSYPIIPILSLSFAPPKPLDEKTKAVNTDCSLPVLSRLHLI
jgi:hypothetical protein